MEEIDDMKENKIKYVDNHNGKVKNAGKVIGGICGVVVLAGMAVTAFAAGENGDTASDGTVWLSGNRAVSEVSSYSARGARAARGVSAVNEICATGEVIAAEEADPAGEVSTVNEIISVGETSAVNDTGVVSEYSAVNDTGAVSEYSEVSGTDAYWMKQMSVSGLNVTDVDASSSYESVIEDVKGDDTRQKALKKSFQGVNEAYLKQKAEMEKKETEWKKLIGNVKDWSNSKFGNELDKLAGSMRIICDQLSTIQDDCYYNLDALTYGADNYDSDYEKWDTVFEEAASIQRRFYLQLDHIYQKITDETMKEYEKNGLKYDEKTQEYSYNGKKVRYFEDGVWDGQSFSGSMTSGNSGEVDVFATRDKNGDLTGFEVYGIDNTKDRVKEHYNSKENIFSGGSSDSAQESAS